MSTLPTRVGRVLRSTGSWYDVQIDNPTDDDPAVIQSRVRGKFRLQDTDVTNPVAVGDRVTIRLNDDDDTGLIVEIHDRENRLSRRASGRRVNQEHIMVSNIDCAWAVQSVKQPALNLGFVDRFLVMAEVRHIPAGLIINKIDLAEQDKVTEIETVIRQLNPLAELIHTTYCQFDLRSLDQLMTQAPPKENQPTVNSPENRPNSFVLKTEGTFAREKFHDFLSAVGKDAYRMKGFFHLEEGWHQVDVVGTQIRMNPTEHSEENSRLVIISNIGLPIIRKIFHHWEHRFTEKITLR